MTQTQEEYEALLARAVNNFSDRDYFTLMDEALDRVDARFDKRPGSMVWNGNAPSLAELAQLYTALDFVFNATYIRTAPREYLIKRAADRSIAPYPATPATYCVLFSTISGAPVPRGTRFSAEELNFEVITWPKLDEQTGREVENQEDGELLEEVEVEDEQTGETGTALMQLIRCETAGTVGNASEGLQLIPIEYVPGLAPAAVGKLVTPGEDEEPTEAFRERVIEAMHSIAFGGNQADYREKVLSINGIGQCKVYPVWNGDLKPADLQPPDAETVEAAETAVNSIQNADVKTYLSTLLNASAAGKLTVGGTVRVVVASTDNAQPVVSAAKIGEVQDTLDPKDHAAEGRGLAPIGHLVTVASIQPRTINITIAVQAKTGTEPQSAIRSVIEDWFRTLTVDWDNQSHITVYNAMLQYQIMRDCSALIEDIDEPILAGADARGNLVLDTDEYPVLGTLTVTDIAGGGNG